MSHHPTDAAHLDLSPRRPPLGVDTVLEALPSCAALLDDDGVVVACNASWRRLHLALEAGASALAIAFGLYFVKVFLLAMGVTLVEVTNAKLRLFRVPELMAASLGLGFLALAIRFL